MNKNLYKGISFAVLAMLATACQNNEDFGSEYDNNPNAVIVNASIGERTKTRVSTESETVDKWDSGDAIGIKGGATDKTAIYTYNGTTWTVGNEYLTWDATKTNNFTAWYPATAAYDAFTLPKDQSTGISGADWMTASKSDMSKPTDKLLDLQFAHKLSKVTLNVTKYGEEFNGTAPAISNVKFYIAGTPSVTGATVESSATSVTPYTGTQADGKPNYTAILLPGTYTNGTSFIEIDVTSDGQTKTLTVTIPNALTSAGLEATKAYTFNLTVGKGAISIASVTVNEWTTSDMGSGTATDEPETQEEPAVGSYYYSDGTWSAELKSGKTPVGIIVYVGEQPASDISTYTQKDGTTPLTIKGYVFALYDANNGEYCMFNSFEGLLGISQSTTDYNGYNNTQLMRKYLTNHPDLTLENDFPALYLATEAYEAQGEQYKAPDKSSGWFIPSAGQFAMIFYIKATVLAAIKKVPGCESYAWKEEYYWSSTQYNGWGAQGGMRDVLIYDGTKPSIESNYQNRGNDLLRSFLAF